jgi:hypothetical protein
LGFIVASKRGECEAYDHRGISLGRFPDKASASEAIYEKAAKKAIRDEARN